MRKQVKAPPTGENNLAKGLGSCTCLEKQKSMSIIGAYSVMQAVVVDEAMIVLARA